MSTIIFSAGTAPTYATTDIAGYSIPDSGGYYTIGAHNGYDGVANAG